MRLGSCLACGASNLEPVAHLGESPVLTGALFDSRAAAEQAVCGPLDLNICLGCSHVQNVAFDPTLVQYDVSYDNSLHFSGTFQRYADDLIGYLVEEYGIRGMRIVEIGSGKGDFLRSICAAGNNVGTGYDPTAEANDELPGVQLVKDYFRPGDQLESYELLICRHVIEHLDDPSALLTGLADAGPKDALFYFEVPAAEFNFGSDGLWDCIYPHVSYFSTDSLATLLERCGFEIVALRRSFHGQFISAEARHGAHAPRRVANVEPHLMLVEEFAEDYRKAVIKWRTTISQATEHGELVAVWGVGSKGVNFLRAVDPYTHLTAVDINPRKWGKFLPATGHEILSPSALADRDPATVIATNSVYLEEIRKMLVDLGSKADVVAT